MPTLALDRYYRYAELTELLESYGKEHPELVRIESIGKSYEGRDIWVATLTSFATGPDREKPALWLDGSIHASELAPSTLCLYLIDRLLRQYGDDPDVTRCLDTRAFYVCPRMNPDGAELALAPSPRIIRSSTRPYPFDEEPLGGLVVEDVDGDGRILSMRIPDANGAWKTSPLDPRLLVRRDPTESAGRYYRVLPEGRLAEYDGVTIRLQRRKEGLDLNRNFPAEWRQNHEQRGAGPYPASEPEVRAVVDFLVSHPNTTAGIAGHTYAGALLRPFSYRSDEHFAPDDLRTFKAIGEKGTALTGYPAISVYHDFRYDPKEVITGALDDWLFAHLGVFSWTIELWDPQRRAGIEKHHFIEWDRQHPHEDDLKMLRWSDGELRGQGYIDWYPFDHPQLGRVELGGWDRLHAISNPPLHLLEREIARFPEWFVWHLLISPRLELLEQSVRPLGDGVYAARVVLHNTGWLPSYVTRHALDHKLVRGVVCELDLPPGAVLESGELRSESGQLEGRAYKSATPGLDPTDDRLKLEWVIRAPAGGVARVEARHDRAGVVRTELRLE
jgi:murein tripeptide amidase MpaA